MTKKVDKKKTLEDFKKSKANYEKTIKALNDDLKACLIAEAQEIFTKYPMIDSMGIPAYTPYWNDGDTCSYYACTDDPQINEVDPEDYEDDDEEEGEEREVKAVEVPDEALDEVAKFFSSYPEEFYEKTFDEGVITLYRDGKVEVLEYEHD